MLADRQNEQNERKKCCYPLGAVISIAGWCALIPVAGVSDSLTAILSLWAFLILQTFALILVTCCVEWPCGCPDNTEDPFDGFNEHTMKYLNVPSQISAPSVIPASSSLTAVLIQTPESTEKIPARQSGPNAH